VRLTQLRSFYAVARMGSFTKAAQMLHLSQPTLTTQVRFLEERYQVELLFRRGRQVVPTEMGEQLMQLAQQIFTLEGDAISLLEDAGELRTGHLRVAAVGPYHVTQMLVDFNRRYPAVRVSVSTGNSEDVLDRLLDYRADVGVLAQVVSDDRLLSVPFSRHPVVVFTSTAHRFARRRSIRIAELEGERHLDDKVLASWNGLMLGALARAGVVLGEPKYLAAAEKNLTFLQAKLWDAKTKTLYHRWRDGERDNVQLLDSHAYLLDGVIHLYEATLDPKHLDFALALESAMTAKFYDAANGGFYQSPAGSADLLFRAKEDYDGAEPSGNNVATIALLKLAAITDNKEMRARAEKTLRLFAERMQRLPQAVPNLLLALDFFLHEPFRVVIASPAKADARAISTLLRAAHGVYQPTKVVLGNAGAVEPFAKTLPVKDGPVVFICTGTACQPPTSDPVKVKSLLAGKTP